jgi:hypothetical protein
MTIVTGKHKEILVELLIYYLKTKVFILSAQAQEIVIDIKSQNEEGQWYINYYINN